MMKKERKQSKYIKKAMSVFILRVIELAILIGSCIAQFQAVNAMRIQRGNGIVGGEGLIFPLGLLLIMFIESVMEVIEHEFNR